MSSLGYLLLPVSLFPVWLLIFCKKDFQPILIKSGLIGAVCGLLSEIWFKKDYWNPISILNSHCTIIEDSFTGFFLFGISITFYNYIFRINPKNDGIFINYKVLVYFFTLGLIALVFTNFILNINSIFAFCFVFVSISLFIFINDIKMLSLAIKNGFLLLVLFTSIYIAIYDYLIPNFWENTLVAKESLIKSNYYKNAFPISELIWYFTWGMFSLPFYEYLRVDTAKKNKPISTKLSFKSDFVKLKNDS